MSPRQAARLLGVLLAAAMLVPAASGSASSTALPASYPAAGEVVAMQIAVHAAPDRTAPVIRYLHQFRSDYRLQVVLALGQATGVDGRTWFKVSLPMRPNGTIGWIPAGTVTLQPTRNHIVVHRGLRTIDFFRGARRLLHATHRA